MESESELFGWLLFDLRMSERFVQPADDLASWRCFVSGLIVLAAGVILPSRSTPLTASWTRRSVNGLQFASHAVVAIWLEEILQSSRPDYRWLIAQYHKPVYPAVKSPGSGQKSWVPLFEKYNLDLACESDGHNIKRTVPIRDGKPADDGVVYIGEGGLGVSQRTPKPGRWFLQPPGMADQGSHVFLLTFTPDHLLGQCVLLNGEIRDRFLIKPRPSPAGWAR